MCFLRNFTPFSYILLIGHLELISHFCRDTELTICSENPFFHVSSVLFCKSYPLPTNLISFFQCTHSYSSSKTLLTFPQESFLTSLVFLCSTYCLGYRCVIKRVAFYCFYFPGCSSPAPDYIFMFLICYISQCLGKEIGTQKYFSNTEGDT